jgi:hypothetical protein
MEKQKVLIRALYRRLMRESKRIPDQPSVLHSPFFPSFEGGKNHQSLQSDIRQKFRIPSAGNKDTMERIEFAMEGLRMLYSVDDEAEKGKETAALDAIIRRNNNNNNKKK